MIKFFNEFMTYFSCLSPKSISSGRTSGLVTVIFCSCGAKDTASTFGSELFPPPSNPKSLEDLNFIYEFIIIDEIFNVKEYRKERGNDNFDDSVNKILENINRRLDKVNNAKFFNEVAVNDIEHNNLESELEIFYKSSELGKRFVNIKEYLKFKKYNFVILNNNNVTDFQENIVYRYTGECFFEIGERNEIITYFIYNNQKIKSYTSVHNWLNQSILSNYAYEEASRYFNCYFFYDQGRMFKFFQISEANITAEI